MANLILRFKSEDLVVRFLGWLEGLWIRSVALSSGWGNANVTESRRGYLLVILLLVGAVGLVGEKLT